MNWRSWHRKLALVITLPLIMIVLTGLLLELRNQIEWVQPSTVSGVLEKGTPLLSLEDFMSRTGGEIDQVIYRPSKGNVSVRLKDGMEFQFHPQSGQLLKKAHRRTAWLIDLHQGSWLGPFGQYFIHIITGLSLLFLVISGFVMWPFWRQR